MIINFLNDSVLIEQALNGNQQAYRELYEKHADHLFCFLMQFSQDRQLVADWVQQSFIKAFTKLKTFEGKSQFRTWLFSIGINEMRSALRKTRKLTKIEMSENVSDLFIQKRDLDNWMSVKSAIRELDHNKRLVFLLHEVEGYSHREIADMLGVGESTSRTILSRTKMILREILTES